MQADAEVEALIPDPVPIMKPAGVLLSISFSFLSLYAAD
jgi:hypothetical protein